jgi:hypothetical protein
MKIEENEILKIENEKKDKIIQQQLEEIKILKQKLEEKK